MRMVLPPPSNFSSVYPGMPRDCRRSNRGAPRRTVRAAAVLLLATTSTGLVAEQNEFKTAGGFVDAYHQKNNDIYMRLYIRGIGDGISVYNAMQDESDGGRKLYCPA